MNLAVRCNQQKSSKDKGDAQTAQIESDPELWRFSAAWTDAKGRIGYSIA